MKRRNAIFLGSAFLLIVAGYVAWCWRAFYLPNRFDYHQNVPADAKPAIEEWRKKEWWSLRFDWDEAASRIAHPWQETKPTWEVHFAANEDAVLICDPGTGHAYVYFVKEQDQWKGYWYHNGKPLVTGSVERILVP